MIILKPLLTVHIHTHTPTRIQPEGNSGLRRRVTEAEYEVGDKSWNTRKISFYLTTQCQSAFGVILLYALSEMARHGSCQPHFPHHLHQRALCYVSDPSRSQRGWALRPGAQLGYQCFLHVLSSAWISLGMVWCAGNMRDCSSRARWA